MKRLRRAAAAVVTLLPFLSQATGAAEIGALAGRAVLAPPPGRFAPRPSPGPAPIPAPGRRWLEDLRAVASWGAQALAPAGERPEPAAFTAAAPAPRPPEPALALEPAPPAPPPADRILIAGGSGVIGAFGELESFSLVAPARLAVYRERFTGFWSKGNGLSVRVDYLRPWGINRADAEGFTLLLKGRSPHRIQARRAVPPLLRREHPIYFPGEDITLEMTLRNDGTQPLRALVVEAWQEGLTLDGGPGPRLDEARRVLPPELAPGAEVRVRWTARISRRNGSDVCFEQTAVRVTGGDGEKGKVYLDVHQAGIVDPPSR